MRLARGSQRLLGELPQEPASLFNTSIAGRAVKAEPFDVDVSNATALWLVVQENGSSAPERIEAVVGKCRARRAFRVDQAGVADASTDFGSATRVASDRAERLRGDGH